GELLPPVDWSELARELADYKGDDPAPGTTGEATAEGTGDGGADSEAGPGREFISFALYPTVYKEFLAHQRTYSDTWLLDTPVFFYGLNPGEQTSVEIEPGKTLIIKLVGIGQVQPDGTGSVWFELNGQHREVTVRDEAAETLVVARPKAVKGDPRHVGAPMPGRILKIDVDVGQAVKRNESLGVIEAMKMEIALVANGPGRVR